MLEFINNLYLFFLFPIFLLMLTFNLLLSKIYNISIIF